MILISSEINKFFLLFCVHSPLQTRIRMKKWFPLCMHTQLYIFMCVYIKASFFFFFHHSILDIICFFASYDDFFHCLCVFSSLSLTHSFARFHIIFFRLYTRPVSSNIGKIYIFLLWASVHIKKLYFPPHIATRTGWKSVLLFQ